MAREATVLGYFYVLVGVVLFIFGAWELIFRVIAAILGLYLINYGLMLSGQPPLFYTVNRILNIIVGRRWQ